jgi:hypothetical protein
MTKGVQGMRQRASNYRIEKTATLFTPPLSGIGLSVPPSRLFTDR